MLDKANNPLSIGSVGDRGLSRSRSGAIACRDARSFLGSLVCSRVYQVPGVPDFDRNLLALGISGGTYVALQATESNR